MAGIALFGCGKGSPSASAPIDADFSPCSGSPAVHYAPGISVASASGAYVVSIESALTTLANGGRVSTAAIGYDAFTVAVASAATGAQAADAGVAAVAKDGGPPAGVTVTATLLPWMPVHMHGASTLPTVTGESDGAFSVAEIDFFMAGYWQLPLNLVPASGVTDAVVFSICIPD